MYQLDSAIVKPIESSGRWRTMDIGNVQLRDLFRDFKRVIATLIHPSLQNKVSFELGQYLTKLGGNSLTFNQWLIQNGNNTLPTSTDLPVINTRYAKFSDAIRSGYLATPTHPTISPTSPVPIEERTDLLLTRASTDYQLVKKHCLANVNGFYHRTDVSSAGLYIVDGMKSCLKSRRNEVGLLSFLELGELDFITLTDDMVYTHRPEQRLANNCYFDTGVDLSQKTVMLVLGGYLHLLDKSAFFRISNSAFGFDFSQIPLIERYYESCNVLDLSVLEMESTPHNPAQISINNLYSDEVIRRYMTMSQSFLVVLDKTDIFVESIAVEDSPFPGTYTSYANPVYPLTVGCGRHEVYWPRKEYDRYSITVNNTWHGDYTSKTVKTRDLHSVSDAQQPALGYRNDFAQFMLIGTDV